MTRVRCWLLRRKLSAYLDGEIPLAARPKVERHLRACESCGSVYVSIATARRTISELPRLQPRETFSLGWQVHPGDVHQDRVPWLTRRAVRLALASAVVAVMALAINIAFNRSQRSSGLVIQAYALDIGMYLDGVSQDRSELNRFAEFYESRPVSLEQAQAHVGFKIDAPPQLPGGFSFAGAYLLKSGCCPAVRLRYQRPEAQVDVFQQPHGHPVTFGSKTKFVPAVLPDCHGARSGAHQAYYWEGADKGLVVVSDLPESEMVALVRALRLE